MLSLFRTLVIAFSVFSFAAAQSSAVSTAGGDGYTGYNLTLSDDPESATYETENTSSNVSTTFPEPDVYLNASVFIGEISILVANLTAKINLDAQVLSLLKFNAGVDLHIDKVSLLIQNVTAKVLLEARLENLVLMIDDILHSLDLNPILATLGQNLNDITNATTGLLTGVTDGLSKRSEQLPFDYELEHNILYSMNDYTGHTHLNRVLAQDGSLVDQSLNDMGRVIQTKVVGNYLTDMTFKGDNVTTTHNGQEVQQLEYIYEPYRGLSVVSFVYVNGQGSVVATQVMTEAFAGGSSTIGDN